MNPLIRKLGGVIVMHTVKSFVGPIQRLKHSLVQSYILSPASNSFQCSVHESTLISPAYAIGLSMLDPFHSEPTFYAD